jgi:hypothetical protein
MTRTLDAMKSAARWLLHHNKKPFYAATLSPRGTTDTEDDQRQLVDYAEAVACLERHQRKGQAQGFGLGFALGADGTGDFWQGIDLDKIDQNGLSNLASHLPGYVEHSPSGKGVHAIGYGQPFVGRTRHKVGIEFYSRGRYFTFTGNTISDGSLTDLSEFVDGYLRLPAEAGLVSAPLQTGSSQIVVAPETYDDLAAALKVIPADDYEIWHTVLQALKRLSDSKRTFRLAMDWSMSSPNPEHGYDVFMRKWEGDLDTPGPLTYKTIFLLADQHDAAWRTKVVVPDFWQEVDLSNLEIEPIDYLIDDFLARSLMVLVGKPGMGKSTAMMSVIAAVAGVEIPDSPLRSPVVGRKVIYITEDTEQFKRNLIALKLNFGIDTEVLRKALVLLPARRVSPIELLGLRTIVEQHTTSTPDGIVLRPWIVVDTAAASIHLEDENSNAEVSTALALLKAEFFERMNCSVCLITHSTKQASRADFVTDPRGAGAWGGDTTLTMGIFEDQGIRFLSLGKHRYSPLHTALQIELVTTPVTVADVYGRSQTQILSSARLRWADSSPLVDAALGRAKATLDSTVLQFIHTQVTKGKLHTFNSLVSVREDVQLGLGKDRLKDSLQRLENDGLLEKGDGVRGSRKGWEYRLTKPGLNALSGQTT